MRTRLVAVVGSGSALAPEHAAVAEELGAALVRAGFGIVCGGLLGVMEAVARGARKQRGMSPHPPVLGLLPDYDVEAGNEYLDLVVPTGLGHARNALVAAGGEVVICLGGAMGSLSEVALARKIGRPVISLVSTGGTAHLVSKAVKSVIAVRSAEAAVAKVKQLIGD